MRSNSPFSQSISHYSDMKDENLLTKVDKIKFQENIKIKLYGTTKDLMLNAISARKKNGPNLPRSPCKID